MDFGKYKNRLEHYLGLKGYNNFNNNIKCFSGTHEDNNPSMKIKNDIFKCYSCGFKGDIYDAIAHFEKIGDKKEQFIFAEKLFGNGTEYIKPTKKTFEIDKEAYDIVTNYIRDQITNGQKYIKFFVNKRGYYKKLATEFSRYLGFWPGFKKAESDLGIEVLKKAGIPTPEGEKKYSSWHRSGIVCKFENGYKLMYIKEKDEKTETVKRGSKGSNAFPYPSYPETKSIILVEAELSAIACRIIGINNACATGGINAITKKNLESIKNYEEIIFMFDGDKPGQEGCQKIVKKLLKTEYKGIIKIVDLPKNKDPDDLIKELKVNILKKCIQEARLYDESTRNNCMDSNNIDNNSNIDLCVGNEIKEKEYSYNELAELLEKSFFVKNAETADKTRPDINLIKKFIFERPELAFQEAARLYFIKKKKEGIKLQESSVTDTIWLYDTLKKYWCPMLDKLNHEPAELFIQKYNAIWMIKGKKGKFHFKKNNTARSEIEKSFAEYVKGNITPEQEPFNNNSVKKIISCKNCVLEWDYEEKKFIVKNHGKEHNLTVSPFPFNRIDTKSLNEDQTKRKNALHKYFYGLVKWIDDEKEQNEILKFLMAYIGYTLTPWREKCFHVWIGSKDSGKSTLKEIIKIIHGNKYAEADFSRWNKQKSPHDNEILPGKLVLADDDFQVGGRLPERELKTLSQNGTVTINPKHVSQFTIMNTATPLILTNGMPRAEDITLENRLYALPFQSDFSRIKRNIESEKFINYIKEHETLEILFNLAIDIAEQTIFNYGNFDEFTPKTILLTSSQIIDSASSVLMWIDDMKAQGELLVNKNDKEIRIRRTDLYKLYNQHYSGAKKGLHAFYEAVRQKFQEFRSGGNDYFYGIAVKCDEPEEQYKNQVPYNDD
jgi:DNA primase